MTNQKITGIRSITVNDRFWTVGEYVRLKTGADNNSHKIEYFEWNEENGKWKIFLLDCWGMSVDFSYAEDLEPEFQNYLERLKARSH